jgi:hypothetical protein
MRRRALVALVLGLACGPSRPVEDPIVLETFLGDFAAAYCHRVYGCCMVGDLPTVSPGTNEEECTAEMIGFAADNAAFLLGFRGIVFDTERAAHCLDVLRHGACGSIFEVHSGAILPCQDMFPGTREAGDSCDDRQECASERCSGGTCQAMPSPTCHGGEYLDRTANVCVAQRGLGAACTSTRQCLPDESCHEGVCVPRAPDGQPCDGPDACVGTCGAGGSCRPGYCRGR